MFGELILNSVPLRLAEVGEHPRSYGCPLGHPPMHSFLWGPILISATTFGSPYLTETADGNKFTDEDEEAVTTLAKFAGLAIDHARRYTSAATRGDELARTVAALEAKTEIARAVGGATDVDVILELVAKRGRAPVSAQALLIEIVDGAELVVAATAGHRPAGLLRARIALADTVASAALLTRATHRLEVELNRARFDQHGLGRLGVSADAGLVVPLILHNQTYGVLIALDRLHDGPAFAAEDQGLLEGFATSAAIFAATARSAASELQRQRLAAAEGKRGHWARELHDETLQNPAGLRLSLSTAHQKGGLTAREDAVVQAIENLEEGISKLRALVTDLRPAALDEPGLKPAIERASRHGLEIDSSLDLAFEQGREPTRHTPELETLIYRIIQQALTNATKHGHATREVIETRESTQARLSSASVTTVRGSTQKAAQPDLAQRAHATALNCGTRRFPGNGTTRRCERPHTAPPGQTHRHKVASHTRRGRRDHRARAPHDLRTRSHRRPLVTHVTPPPVHQRK